MANMFSRVNVDIREMRFYPNPAVKCVVRISKVTVLREKNRRIDRYTS